MIHRYDFYLDHYSGGMRPSKKGEYCLAAEVLGPGTWLWALEQMKSGKIVQDKTDTGFVKYRLSVDGEGRIEWAYTNRLPASWTNAFLFLSDFECTDWEVWNEKGMSFKKAIAVCHSRSAIYRAANPSIRYYNNHVIPLENRIPIEDQGCDDWLEYDPRDEDSNSLFMYND